MTDIIYLTILILLLVVILVGDIHIIRYMDLIRNKFKRK